MRKECSTILLQMTWPPMQMLTIGRNLRNLPCMCPLSARTPGHYFPWGVFHAAALSLRPWRQRRAIYVSKIKGYHIAGVCFYFTEVSFSESRHWMSPVQTAKERVFRKQTLHVPALTSLKKWSADWCWLFVRKAQKVCVYVCVRMWGVRWLRMWGAVKGCEALCGWVGLRWGFQNHYSYEPKQGTIGRCSRNFHACHQQNKQRCMSHIITCCHTSLTEHKSYSSSTFIATMWACVE